MMNKARASEKPDNQVKTILVVEDDRNLGDFLTDIFRTELRSRVLLATNGREALEIVTVVIPDLFVLDYHLPDTNGLQLAHHFQATKALKHVPILLMSANLPKGELEQSSITSIKKPFELESLLQTVESLLTS